MVQIRSTEGGKEVCYDEKVACSVTYTANRGSDMQKQKGGEERIMSLQISDKVKNHLHR